MMKRVRCKHKRRLAAATVQAILLLAGIAGCAGSSSFHAPSSAAQTKFDVDENSTSLSPKRRTRGSGGHRYSWLTQAISGIPFLIDRVPNRKLSNAVIKPAPLSEGPDRSVAQLGDSFPFGDQHRFLAFGDYADHSFECPATTTCPVVCVAAVENCPDDGSCPGTHPDNAYDADHVYELCNDGTCADLTAGEACDPGAESPCGCEALPVTCAKQVDLYPNCVERFQEYYDANTECLEAEVESLPQVDFTGPWFMAFYLGMSSLTVVMLLWCAWNQRLAKVPGSTVPLVPLVGGNVVGASSLASGDATMTEEWTQTGYTGSFVGMVLYALVILAHLVIQFLLFAFTLEYYVQQEATTKYVFGKQIFFDELQVLKAFEIVWMVGVAWCFFLKYPVSIYSLFLRRCLHARATHIAVCTPVQSSDTQYKVRWIAKLLASMGYVFKSVLSFVYSDESQQPGRKVTFCKVHVDPKTGARYFNFRMRRYIFDNSTSRFIPGCWDISHETVGRWLDKGYLYQGLTIDEVTTRLSIVGPNVLDFKKPTILGSMMNEFKKPFYLYQNFMVWTWAPYWYYYMALLQTAVRITGGVVVSIFQYMSDISLYSLMEMEGTVEVVRGGSTISIDQVDVVPGDIVVLKPGVAYFDMAVLQSKHLLVDEGALTGEVHPIAKVALDPATSDSIYDPRKNKSSTLWAGTTILECGEGQGTDGDLAIVTKTGSFTAKGELLSDVLSYERHKFKFDTEVKLVLAILVVEAAVLLGIVFRFIEDNWEYAWFYAMFVVGTVLPPLLPTVFVVSVGISCRRLQSMRITCSDSRGILIAGKVTRAFFDKTGTLTKQGLEFMNATRDESSSPNLSLGLAVCHTLNVSSSGELIGASVDRMGFSSNPNVKLVDPSTISYENETIQYLKKFEFDHHLMTQSVIIRRGDESIVFVKGSPEAIAKLCVESSLPEGFEEKARQAARDGVYQLAIATAPYKGTQDLGDVKREDIEKDLQFVGFINFQNTMKEDTPSVIQDLREGDVSSTIVTGDNVLTGIFIARKAGIIPQTATVVIGNNIREDETIEWINAADDSPAEAPSISNLTESSFSTLALTGKVWNHLLQRDPGLALEYAKHTCVFGRCTPNDKVSIVSTFVEIGEITLMCGDGGNDCGALKAAHVGVALSDAEASVVAPFTSLDKTITSVVDVLKEGRCALASALASYKYMIMYGQVESFNQVANAYFSITFTEWCWVFMDGIWTLTMAFSLPLARAARKLSKKRPTASILGWHTLSSACGVLAINFLFLVFGLLALFGQDWFQCRKWGSTDVSNILVIGDNYETSVIFIITGYQYISSGAAYNFGYTHRANWWRNYIFVFFFFLWTSWQMAATLSASEFSCIWRLNCDNDHVVRSVTSTEPEAINNNFNTTVMPMEFRGILVALMMANLALICAWDYFVVNRALPKVGKQVGLPEDSQRADVAVVQEKFAYKEMKEMA